MTCMDAIKHQKFWKKNHVYFRDNNKNCEKLMNILFWNLQFQSSTTSVFELQFNAD